MKKSRIFLIVAFLLVTLTLGGTAFGTTAEAAALTNVMKAPKAKAGKWVVGSKGYRYRYNSTGKYAKSAWQKIDNKVYYFKADSYLQTGFARYRGKRYYFNKQGAVQTGWKKVNGKKYYFNPSTGAASTGKVKIASKYYYFDSNGVMKTGWQKIGGSYYYFDKSNGSMAVNKKIGSYYVDKNGKRTKKKPTTSSGTTTDKNNSKNPTKKGKVDIFVGDSRTVGMAVSVDKMPYNNQITSGRWIAKVNEGYSWYVKTAEPKLKAKLKKDPDATVVINFGVNDLNNCSKYISRYKALMKKYPKANIYIMSVNPTDSSKYHGYATNTLIKNFNKKMKAAFPNNYIDCYTYMTKKGFKTTDGLHYQPSTYNAIYKYVLSKV